MRYTRSGGLDHVADRYTRWCLDIEPSLTAAEKAIAYEAFALEFAPLPPHLEPDSGWANEMAYLLRRIARRHRGEPVGEWVPAYQRQAATGHAAHVTDSPRVTESTARGAFADTSTDHRAIDGEIVIVGDANPR